LQIQLRIVGRESERDRLRSQKLHPEPLPSRSSHGWQYGLRQSVKKEGVKEGSAHDIVFRSEERRCSQFDLRIRSRHASMARTAASSALAYPMTDGSHERERKTGRVYRKPMVKGCVVYLKGLVAHEMLELTLGFLLALSQKKHVRTNVSAVRTAFASGVDFEFEITDL